MCFNKQVQFVGLFLSIFDTLYLSGLVGKALK